AVRGVLSPAQVPRGVFGAQALVLDPVLRGEYAPSLAPFQFRLPVHAVALFPSQLPYAKSLLPRPHDVSPLQSPVREPVDVGAPSLVQAQVQWPVDALSP